MRGAITSFVARAPSPLEPSLSQKKEPSLRISQLCDAAIEAQIQFFKEKLQKQKQIVRGSVNNAHAYANELNAVMAIESEISFYEKELESRAERCAKKSAA
ncbi:MAG: hypothetical protein Q8R36_02645 [bacterium]|nr:hypothetical protein [bacterium]